MLKRIVKIVAGSLIVTAFMAAAYVGGCMLGRGLVCLASNVLDDDSEDEESEDIEA